MWRSKYSAISRIEASVADDRDRISPARLPCLSVDDGNVVAAGQIAFYLPVELPGVGGAVVLVAAGSCAGDGDISSGIGGATGVRAGDLDLRIRRGTADDYALHVSVLPHDGHRPLHIEGGWRCGVRGLQPQESVANHERLRCAGLAVVVHGRSDRGGEGALAHGDEVHRSVADRARTLGGRDNSRGSGIAVRRGGYRDGGDETPIE